jgi:hypothetical protein
MHLDQGLRPDGRRAISCLEGRLDSVAACPFPAQTAFAVPVTDHK